MQQNYASQNLMECKLLELQQKLKLITSSYLKLKQAIKEKDEQIRELKIENHRISKMQEHKENSYLTEIRKKYEIEGQRFQKMESRIHSGYNADPNLRMAKSLSPQMKVKTETKDYFKNSQI